jgi:hypothetical protein
MISELKRRVTVAARRQAALAVCRFQLLRPIQSRPIISRQPALRSPLSRLNIPDLSACSALWEAISEDSSFVTKDLRITPK